MHYLEVYPVVFPYRPRDHRRSEIENWAQPITNDVSYTITKKLCDRELVDSSASKLIPYIIIKFHYYEIIFQSLLL